MHLYHSGGNPSQPGDLLALGIKIPLSIYLWVMISQINLSYWFLPIEGRSKEERNVWIVSLSDLSGCVYNNL